VYPDAYVGVPPVPPKLTPPIMISLAFVVVTVTEAVVLEALPPTPFGTFGSKGAAVFAPEIAKTANLMLCAVLYVTVMVSELKGVGAIAYHAYSSRPLAD